MQNIERIIIARLIAEAAKRGYTPVQFWDGEEYQRIECGSAADLIANAIAAVDTVDEGTLHFVPTAQRPNNFGRWGVLLILGNGEDVISDWHCGDDAFNAACEATLDAIENRAL